MNKVIWEKKKFERKVKIARRVENICSRSCQATGTIKFPHVVSSQLKMCLFPGVGDHTRVDLKLSAQNKVQTAWVSPIKPLEDEPGGREAPEMFSV